MRKITRKYLDKQPEVGDKIEIVNPTFKGLQKGSEWVVVKTDSYTGDCVWAVGDRKRGAQIIHDSEYLIYEDETLEKVGERVIQRKLFGIPFGKQYEELWEVVDNVE